MTVGTPSRTEHDATIQIGSKEFQERTGRMEHEDRMQEHVKKLLMDKDGKLRQEFLQYINCPLCGADNNRPLFQRWGFTYVQCNECSMMYANPMLNEEMVDFEYETGYEEDWVKMLQNPTQREFDNPKFLNGVQRIEEILDGDKIASLKAGNTPPRILDIGCATGHFLETCRERGWDTTGCELTPSAVEYCKKLGLNVHQKKFQEAGFPEKSFDAISLWDTLEHIPKPKIILQDVKKLLNDSGALLILVPNGGSLAARVLQEKCNMFSGFAHINIFTPQTLTRLLQECGYKVAHMETIISEINVINNFLSYDHPYGGSSPERNSLLGIPQLDEAFIHKNLLGYKILAVCKKA